MGKKGSEKGYANGTGAMLAEERTAAYENGIGAMSAEERTAAYETGIGVMPVEAKMAVSEKGYENGIGVMQAEDRTAASEKEYINGIRAMQAKDRKAASEKGYVNGIGAMCEKDKRSKISETLKARFTPGGKFHVADPFNAYLDSQAVSKPLMRYNNNSQISRFLLSEDKVCIYIIFLQTYVKLHTDTNHSTATSSLQGVQAFIILCVC